MTPTATVTEKPTKTGRTYTVTLSDGRTFTRSSTREKAAIHCPMNTAWKTSTTVDAAKMIATHREYGTAGTIVDLRTGEVLSHRAESEPMAQTAVDRNRRYIERRMTGGTRSSRQATPAQQLTARRETLSRGLTVWAKNYSNLAAGCYSTDRERALASAYRWVAERLTSTDPGHFLREDGHPNGLTVAAYADKLENEAVQRFAP